MHLSKQSSSTKKWLLFLATFCFLGLWSWGTEQASRSEAAVELISFTATANAGNSAVQLRWETAVEIDTAGYRLKRTNSSNEFITVTYFGEETSLIPGDATGLGAIYEAQDTAVTAGNTYIYTLVEIDNSGGQEELDTAVVNLGNGQPTNTPTASNTPTPTATATSGLTLPPTNTPTRAVQASPTSTATPVPQLNPTATSTPEPTVSNNNNNGSNNNNDTTSSTSSTNTNNNSSSGNTSGNSAPSTTNNNNDEEEKEENASTGSTSVAQASEAAQSEQQQQQEGETPEEEREGGATDPLENTDDAGQINEENIDGRDDTAVSTPYPATTPNEGANEALDLTGYQGNEPEPSTSPSQIGHNDDEDSDNTSPENNENQASDNNNLILWGAFLAAMTVFIAGIIGSLLLFMRRR